MQQSPSKIIPIMEWSPEATREFGSHVSELIARYSSSIRNLPISPPVRPADLRSEFAYPFPEEGTSESELLKEFEKKVLPNSFHLGNPRYFGLFNPTPTTIGVFAEALAAMLNQNAAAWNHSPAATIIEEQVIRWMCEAIGFGPEAFGTLTNGGSLANYTGIKVGLNKKFPEISEKGLTALPAQPILYVSEQGHYSIDKVADLVGIGRTGLRKIRTDGIFRIDIHALREQIKRDKAEGHAPFCVVGIAGTTNSGAVDDLAELAKLCEANDLWFHVDAAWGGTARFSKKYGPLLNGIDRADSVTLDPHKWMYVPFCAGAILVRRVEDLRGCFDIQPAYVSDRAFVEGEPTNFFQYGVSGSRRFDALKVWWSFRHYGRRIYEQVINERIELADYLERQLSQSKDFQIVSPANLAMCCFRFFPSKLQEEYSSADETKRRKLDELINALNMRLQVEVEKTGKAWISTTLLHGLRAIRFCVTSYLTTEKDIDDFVSLLKEKAQSVYPHED